jgi:hypothetical protein
MNKLILVSCCFALNIAPSELYSQGTIVFNNLSNNDPSPAAPANGLVFLNINSSWSPLNEDVNFQLVAGPNGLDMHVLHTWLIGDGSAAGITTGSGHFADPTGSIFSIPGVNAGSPAVVAIEAWAGNYPSMSSALAAGEQSGIVIFSSQTGGNGAVPVSMIGMPALGLSIVPEPSALAIGLLGVGFFARCYRVRIRRSLTNYF